MRARQIATFVLTMSLALVALGFGPGQVLATPVYVLVTTIPVPATPDNSVGGIKFQTYDIAFFDGNTQLMYLADRSNAAVDVFSAQTNTFVSSGRIGGTGHLFAGQQGTNNDISGPDGVVVATFGTSKQLWVGDGPSLLKGFDLNNSGSPIPGTPINTGASPPTRVDEMAFDPKDHLLLVANNAASPPFVTLVNTTTPIVQPAVVGTAGGSVVAVTKFDGTGGTPNATAGIEQAVWDPGTGRFYISVPEIGCTGGAGKGPGCDPGGVSVINTAGAVTHTYMLKDFGITSCSPTGLALGLRGQIMIGCGNGINVVAGGTQTILFDPNANSGNGAIVKTFDVSGEDMVWFDKGTNRFFVAARFDKSGPVLGIIQQDPLLDSLDALIQKVPTKRCPLLQMTILWRWTRFPERSSCPLAG